MNGLNSVLLEGTVSSPVSGHSAEKGLTVHFTLETSRTFMRDGQRQSETSEFNVLAYNKTGQTCIRNLKKGSGVRIVGRLWEEKARDGGVYVVAETIEIKHHLDKTLSERRLV